MNVYPVPVDIQLGDDQLIDLFMVQWHTPVPARGHAPTTIPPQFVDHKREILRQFTAWLLAQPAGTTVRPVFVIIPELSMPVSEIQLLDNLVNGMQRPVVIIAGMEYQSWTDYQQLLQTLPDMPHPQSWLQDGQPHSWVNAGRIWIRDENRQIKRYVQPKCHPAGDEQAIPLHQGAGVLVFQSATQAHGRRLNFLTQICSDFTDATFVRDLRRQVATTCQGICLDFTFLLQMNPDQEAGQFKQAIKEYFEPPVQLVHTEDGSLVFVNNANERDGKSPHWGDTKFHFSFQRSWPPRDFPPPTYWMRKDGPHNYQAVAFRERGPGIYWTRYKPHYLVSRTPGGPQLVPFADNHGLFAPIHNQHFGVAGNANPFVAIPAVCHWLFSEWREGNGAFGQYLQANQTNQQVATHCLSSYANGVEEWRQAVANHDDLARPALSIYFECWQGDLHVNFPATEAEPLAWCSDVNDATKWMMNVYALLRLGASGFPGNTVIARPEGVSHGCSEDDLRITLMWGGGRFQPDVMTTRYLAARGTRGAVDLLSQKTLLVLIQPSGRIVASELEQRFSGSTDDLTRGAAIPGIAQPGDVVTQAPPQLRWMDANDLLHQVPQATSPIDLEPRLANVVRSAVG